jgi:hypothetical protein
MEDTPSPVSKSAVLVITKALLPRCGSKYTEICLFEERRQGAFAPAASDNLGVDFNRRFIILFDGSRGVVYNTKI